MTDVQDAYRRVSKDFQAAVRAMTRDKWEAQSPCEQWRGPARGGHRGPGALGGAGPEASRALDEITGEPQALAKEIDGPVGKMAAGEIIGQFVTMDLLVHTW